ncbi:hypothetical protein [Dyella tabacisoli]|uniref:DUF3592 domain-containing protein n=1 Tax=Dyella tabacisoli TaxID=2282381 RepID=A0A369UMC1_9GAMM|nr:hypothetical protein [Dyella tabacisoli]RDD81493.1 hypothetical protein DVJ77_09930 [Dyella tabacisoli]
MMRSIFFTAFLFCMGLAGLVVGGIDLYETIDFHLNGQSALMELGPTQKRIVIPSDGYDVHLLDVHYVSAAGDVLVSQKRLAGDIARRLENDEKIPMTYLKRDLQKVYFSGERPESPWAWLVVGVVMMCTFAYALKLRRKEAGRSAVSG